MGRPLRRSARNEARKAIMDPKDIMENIDGISE